MLKVKVIFKRKAFTLIELLVVIAIIAVLMAILMPALRSVREQARRQLCGSQVRQHILAFNMYADENSAKLPLPKFPFGWLWDLDVDVVNYMLRSGMTKDMFYCPSNKVMYPNRDYFWTFNAQVVSDKELSGHFIVSGYVYVLDLAPPGTRPAIDNDPGKSKIWLKTTQATQPARRELTVDATLCAWEVRTARHPDGNFGMVQGGSWGRANLLDSTSHLKTDYQPYGMNIGFLDGHVDWRRYNPEWRAPEYERLDDVPKPRYGGNRKFWW